MRVLITGGATGLGQAIALKWAEKWVNKDKDISICIADINQERGDKTVDMLCAQGCLLYTSPSPRDRG